MTQKIILIYLTGILGIWKAIPLGFLLKAHPLMIFITTTSGSITGILIIYFLGKQIKNYLSKQKNKKGRLRREKYARNIFNKYGIPGLGILGSLLIGPNMTMITGLAVTRKVHMLMYWNIAGCILWTGVLIILGICSIELLSDIASHMSLT